MSSQLKYREQDYIGCDPFEGERDVDVRCKTVKLVRVRKPHRCHTLDCGRTIQPGEVARLEKALIDGTFWGRYYVCLNCMNEWLDELGLDLCSKEDAAQ